MGFYGRMCNYKRITLERVKETLMRIDLEKRDGSTHHYYASEYEPDGPGPHLYEILLKIENDINGFEVPGLTRIKEKK
jgi:hypothetical protein